VVGGRYKTDVNPTYYRIDLVETTVVNGVVTKQEYLPVLRNHRYKINITAGHGRGYDSKEDAFMAKGVNTKLDVFITSKDEKVKEVVYDGQYMLGIDGSKEVLVDKRLLTGKKIYVNTDYPEGWKATAKVLSGAASWLTLGTASGVSGGSYLTFNAKLNNSGSNREGTITIQAGRLFMEIKVTQTAIADIEFRRVANVYAMRGRNNSFTVKSNYPWRVKVEDLYNIVTAFTLSGGTTPTDTLFNFGLVDDKALGYLFRDKTATFTFYSATGAFDDAEQEIHGNFYYSFKDRTFDVYPDDLNNGSAYNWQGAINACELSTTSPYGSGKAWHSPDVQELYYISADVRSNLAGYGFANNTYYWSNHTNGYYSAQGDLVLVSAATQTQTAAPKTETSYPARCIRDK
jgi:hypothetical protein